MFLAKTSQVFLFDCETVTRRSRAYSCWLTKARTRGLGRRDSGCSVLMGVESSLTGIVGFGIKGIMRGDGWEKERYGKGMMWEGKDGERRRGEAISKNGKYEKDAK